MSGDSKKTPKSSSSPEPLSPELLSPEPSSPEPSSPEPSSPEPSSPEPSSPEPSSPQVSPAPPPPPSSCPSGTFQHGLTGKCYKCPTGYNRTASLIGSNDACKGTCSTVYPGSFEHLLTGSCYKCPSSYNRTAALINASDACINPKTCPQIYTSSFEHGLTRKCYTCPSGYNRTASLITASDACATEAHAKTTYVGKRISPTTYKGTNFKPAKKTLDKLSRKTCKQQYGSNAFYDPRNGGECWSCPSGYTRTWSPVNNWDACHKPYYNSGDWIKAVPAGYHKSRATYHRKGYFSDGLSKCPSGSFLDPNGSCYSCPSGTNRTAYAVWDSKACKGKCSSMYSGSFEHGLTGNCYTCPTGYNRTAALIGAQDACINPKTCPYIYPGSFDHGLTRKCYKCPSGYNRSVATIDASNACSKKLISNVTYKGSRISPTTKVGSVLSTATYVTSI
jgi:hypothetical protein